MERFAPINHQLRIPKAMWPTFTPAEIASQSEKGYKEHPTGKRRG